VTTERRLTVIVCLGPTCGDRRGSAALYRCLEETVARRGLAQRITLQSETCFGHCLRGPNILVCDSNEAGPGGALVGPEAPSAVLYNRMTIGDLERVIDKHLMGGMVVRPLLNRLPVRDS
jgi:(2Fe-2S) ferredoxin